MTRRKIYDSNLNSRTLRKTLIYANKVRQIARQKLGGRKYCVEMVPLVRMLGLKMQKMVYELLWDVSLVKTIPVKSILILNKLHSHLHVSKL